MQTPGNWYRAEGPRYGSHGIARVQSDHGEFGTVICQREVYPGSVEYDANLALISEAGTVANRTGLWPEDMAARIKVLENGVQLLSDNLSLLTAEPWPSKPDAEFTARVNAIARTLLNPQAPGTGATTTASRIPGQ